MRPWNPIETREFSEDTHGRERFVLIGRTNVRVESAKKLDGLNALGTPEIAPTREELLAIARYWAEQAVGIDWWWFCTRSTSMSENRLLHSAQSRIAHVAAIVGENAVERALDEVYTKFGQEQDKRDWDIFCNGDQNEWEGWWQEECASIDKASEPSPEDHQDHSIPNGPETKTSG